MAIHEADGYKTEKHDGKHETQTKREHNRINAGTPKIPATKVAPPSAGQGGKSPLAPSVVNAGGK